MKNKIKNVIMFTILMICSIIIVGSIYYYKSYPKQDFDAILYIIFGSIENTSPDVVNNILSVCIPYVIGLQLILTLLLIRKTKSTLHIQFCFRRKNITFQIYPIKLIFNHRVIYISFITIISIITFIKCFRVDEYIINKTQDTKIFEEYYIDSKNVSISFPDKKRNLILILGESFENTILSKENGGAWEYSLMPELEVLAQENTSFSNTDTLGGSLQVYGTTYSAAGNVSITSGTPLIVPNPNSEISNNNYLGGLYTLRRCIKR